MATISSPGIGSNLDVNGIVSKLMAVEQRPLTLLAKKEADYQARLSAFGNIKGALASFQSSLSGLSNASTFQALSANSSDTAFVTASAASTAVAGTYTLDVTKLAQAQKLATAGQADHTAAIGNGTLTFDFGTIAGGTFDAPSGTYTGASFTSAGGGTKTVTIDATNNSLQGIRDAINKANIGVTATIVNDGGASPYRLALSSNNIGKTNSIKISVAGDAALSNLLAHDPAGTQNLAETVTAQNAELKVNGIAVSKASNTITDVIQGVTLNLQKTTTSTISVAVARNTSAASTALNGLVKAYNDLNGLLKQATTYDAATKQGAILQGDATVRTLQTQLRGVLSGPVASSGALTTLSQIGVAFQKDGTLGLDTTKLNNAITNNFDDIAGLFATVGRASDSLISYTSATSSTVPGSYAVNVTTLATQGSATGNVNLGSTTIAAGTTASVTLDGVTSPVALVAGTYTAAQLAVMVQSAINGTSAFSSASSSVAASIDGSGFLHIASNRYGSASNVTLVSGTGTPVTDFMGTATNAAGVDVAGTIDGQAATGSGQALTSTAGNPIGLKIQVNGGSTGLRGTVKYSQGIAYTLNQLTTSLMADKGLLAGKTSGINNSIKDIGKQRDALNLRLAEVEKRYRAQFTKLDAMLGQMNTTSSYLQQQLANLPKMN